MKPRWLEKFRHWLDDTEASFEINPKPRPLLQTEPLFLTIAREIEVVMRREAFTLSHGKNPITLGDDKNYPLAEVCCSSAARAFVLANMD